jgi:hypothetical protein
LEEKSIGWDKRKELKGELIIWRTKLQAKVQWNRAILLAESHKLDPQPLDEGPRPKSGKERLKLHDMEEKSIGWDKKKKELKVELIIWRTKLHAKVQGRVQLKDSICFKWVRICS